MANARIQSDPLQTGMFVCWYPHLDKPRNRGDNGELLPESEWKYDVGAIFDLTKDKKWIDQLLLIEHQVKTQAFPKMRADDWTDLQRSIKMPKAADVEKHPEHLTNKIIFTFRHHNSDKVQRPPGIGKYNPQTGQIEDLEQGCGEFYTGCFAVAKVVAFHFTGKKNGVAFGLNSCFKVRDGVAFGGGPQSASTAFADFKPEDIDLTNEKLFALPPGFPGAGGLSGLGV